MSFRISPASAWHAALLALALLAASDRASAACGFDVTTDFGQHDAAFQQCLDTTCCSPSKTCYADVSCRELFTCIETKCAPNDAACESSCQSHYPANQSEFLALWNCTMKCPASGGAAGYAGATGAGASGGFGATSGGFGAMSSGGKPSGSTGGAAPNPFGPRGGSGTTAANDGEGAGGAADPQTVAFCATKGPGNARGGAAVWSVIALAIVAVRGLRRGGAR